MDSNRPTDPSRRRLLGGAIIGVLSAGLGLYSLISIAAPPPANPLPPLDSASTLIVTETPAEQTDSPKTAVATLAGGCFWCTEAVFERMVGVQDVVSGYIGGQLPNPTYQAVCTGTTGHAEAVEIKYDPQQVTFPELLEVFFATHDPTTLNRQGADVGTQYRSAIFYHDDEQKSVAEAYIKQLNETREFRRRPIVTTLEPASKFYVAEEYHQDYFRLNPLAGYCQAVVRPKVMKFQKEFKQKLKD
ncbi:MAG: peptide-methionine (S)-S-oxide reductase [Planctomycetaceae bacterium]|nr:MAG: peptide-methionine (S)-S-oxide reductase [Planctomycetaceae bacterium]